MWVVRDKRFKDALNIFDLGQCKDDVALTEMEVEVFHCEAGLWQMIRSQSYALSRHLGHLSEPKKAKIPAPAITFSGYWGYRNVIHKKII